MTDRLTFVELFAGIGGFSLGFERAGMNCIGHCEINPYARQVLKKNWPEVPLWEDVTKLQPEDLGNPDVICGGFPCQDLSVAGKKKGIKGERSGLFQEIIRLCRDIRPKYIVLENVRALSSKQDWFCEVLARLCEIGYDAEWEVISASQFGAPHKRERVWIVAYPRCTLWTGSNEEGKYREEGKRRTTSKLEQPSSSPKTVAYPHSVRLQEERSEQQATRTNQLCGQLSDTRCENGSSWRLSERTREEKPSLGERCKNEGWTSSWETIWSVEPDVGGTPNGFPMWLYNHCGRKISYEKSYGMFKELQDMWNEDVSEAVQWAVRGFDRLEISEVLLAFMCEYKRDSGLSWGILASKETLESVLLSLWRGLYASSTPQRWEQVKQYRREHRNPLCDLSQFASSWESGINRVAHGISKRVDRLKCLGNALIPQIAEWIGHQIVRDFKEKQDDR